MYTTCTFCLAPLGRNEAVEQFPVGRRLAFDQARGRLWVVCAACRQWNLSPLEERWEAVEEAERLFRGARRRVSTDHIGLAQLPDGTELVRIGQPQRPEFAAWRYGDRFTRRWRRTMLWGLGGAAVMGGWVWAGPVMGLAIGGVGAWPFQVLSWAQSAYNKRRILVRHSDAQGAFAITPATAGGARILRDSTSSLGWSLQVHGHVDHSNGRGFLPNQGVLGLRSQPLEQRIIRDIAAITTVQQLLPRLNSTGGRPGTVKDAVKLLEAQASPERIFLEGVKWSGRPGDMEKSWELGSMYAEIRLALEMAAHEDTERRALEGELALLEARWREAEEIAAIADELTLPERVTQRLERLLGSR